MFFSLSLSLSEYLGFVIDMCDLQWYIRQKFGWILDCCSRSAERRFLTLSHWTRVIRLNKKIKSAQKPKLQIYSASILYDYQPSSDVICSACKYKYERYMCVVFIYFFFRQKAIALIHVVRYRHSFIKFGIEWNGIFY